MTDQRKVAAVLDEIAEKHGVTVEEITGKRRFRELVAARTEAAQKLYQLGITMREVGKILNRHPTLIYDYMRKAWTP